MKKLIAILLALVVLFSFAACKGGNESTDPSVDTPDVSESSEPSNEAPAEGSPAQALLADFKAKVADGETDVEILANALVANEIITFMGGAMPVEEGYLNGFANGEITGFVKGAQFAPMISTIPFIGYVFELAEDADADAFVSMLKDNADLRWNVCTEADEMVCEAEGNLVFFVMSPMAFED